MALSALATESSLTGRMASGLGRPRVHFLYFHHVFKDETSNFVALIKRLQSTHTIISHSEAIQRIYGGRIESPFVSISFDDGFKNCLTAARILEEHGVRGCFFVCPSIIGEIDESKIEAFCRRRLGKPPLEFMDWNDLERLKNAGHEIGSHSMNHANLAQTSSAELADEIGRSRQRLVQRIGSADHFAWPYGRFMHFSSAAREAVFAAGHTSCACAVRGCHVLGHGDDEIRELCIRRDHVIAAWPINHTLYFIAKSSRLASVRDNQWPPELKTPAP